MNHARRLNPPLALRMLCCIILLVCSLPASTASTSPPSGIIGPPGSGAFGTLVVVLPNGNLVVTDPYYDAEALADVGAVYLYDGATLGIISMLTGSAAGDRIASGGVSVLANGSYVVLSPRWGSSGNLRAGAATWCSAESGCQGIISSANSLVGSGADNEVGIVAVTLANGDYFVQSPFWDNGSVLDAGAVTWCSGAGGCKGTVSALNSLVGNYAGNNVGTRVITLTNGSYVIGSQNWGSAAERYAGAVTHCGGPDCVGTVSAANSLVGGVAQVYAGREIVALTNGNYVVACPSWSSAETADAGAVTWCSGASGCVGEISAGNSLVGSRAYDSVGDAVYALPGGNYVVASPNWSTGPASEVGAITWCSGTAGCIGEVSGSNSLVGSHTEDHLGMDGVMVLPNGAYVVLSGDWDNGAAVDAGAATWCSASGCVGQVSAANSLVGSQADDRIANLGAAVLADGSYVVQSPSWANGAAQSAGAATWCSATSGCQGQISAVNSLVGSTANDEVGWTVQALARGGYVVLSQSWDNGPVSDAGAATFCGAPVGCSGVVSAANSLVGSAAGDNVGSAARALPNGGYVVQSPNWDWGSSVNAGAATWCPPTGCAGPVSSANSLVGTNAGDEIGRGVLPLANGNYAVLSGSWDNGAAVNAGAVTWCSGASGCQGFVSTANSLVGSSSYDEVGRWAWALANGSYLVHSPLWDNGALADVGAVTWLDGARAWPVGAITGASSVIGGSVSGGAGMNWSLNERYGYLVVGLPAGNSVAVKPVSKRVLVPLVRR